MHGLLRLQEKIRASASGKQTEAEKRPEPIKHQRLPRLPIIGDPSRGTELDRQQIASAASLGWWDELNLEQALEDAASDSDEQDT